MSVAQTILAQLGGRRFIAMTGAKNFSSDDNSLTFCLPGKPGYVKEGINVVKIELTPADEYDMTFSRFYNYQLKEKHKLEGIYCDQLQELFTEYTGLATHL